MMSLWLFLWSVVALAADSPPEARPELGAVLAYEAKDYEASEQLAREVLVRLPESELAMFLLGASAHRNGKVEEGANTVRTLRHTSNPTVQRLARRWLRRHDRVWRQDQPWLAPGLGLVRIPGLGIAGRFLPANPEAPSGFVVEGSYPLLKAWDLRVGMRAPTTTFGVLGVVGPTASIALALRWSVLRRLTLDGSIGPSFWFGATGWNNAGSVGVFPGVTAMLGATLRPGRDYGFRLSAGYIAHIDNRWGALFIEGGIHVHALVVFYLP